MKTLSLSMMRGSSAVVVILGLATSASAQDAPKYSNEFLTIGVGAQALGMGQAITANIQDVNAAYWNPAGLLGVKSDLQVGAMHSEFFAGIAKYDHIGLAKTIDSNSVIGISFIRFGVDNIPNTTDLIDNNGNQIIGARERHDRAHEKAGNENPQRNQSFGAARQNLGRHTLLRDVYKPAIAIRSGAGARHGKSAVN